MAGSTPTDADATDRQHGSKLLADRARDVLAPLLHPTNRGTIAMLAGGALLAAAKGARGRGRTALATVGGLGLVAYGVRQRLSGGDRGSGGGGHGPHDRPDDRTGATDEGVGGTESMRAESHTGTNPRDIDDEPDVEDRADPDEGRVRFTTGNEAEPREEPDLEDDAGTADTRLAAEGDGETGEEADAADSGSDEAVDVDISEAAMADEPNEAAGPTTEQAYPSQVEDTEPDRSPAADASHVEADEPTTDAGEEGTTDGSDEDGSDEDGSDEDGSDGDDVSTEDRYEGERGDDGTVEGEDDGQQAASETDETEEELPDETEDE